MSCAPLCSQARRARADPPRASLSYGYQSNTRVKFIVVLALADAVVRDIDVKTVSFAAGHASRRSADPPSLQIFRAIHNAYISHISNPFTAAETDNPATLMAPIRSRKFAKAMDDIAGPPPPRMGEAA